MGPMAQMGLMVQMVKYGKNTGMKLHKQIIGTIHNQVYIWYIKYNPNPNPNMKQHKQIIGIIHNQVKYNPNPKPNPNMR